jgi:hypothetical protein
MLQARLLEVIADAMRERGIVGRIKASNRNYDQGAHPEGWEWVVNLEVIARPDREVPKSEMSEAFFAQARKTFDNDARKMGVLGEPRHPDPKGSDQELKKALTTMPPGFLRRNAVSNALQEFEGRVDEDPVDEDPVDEDPVDIYAPEDEEWSP